MQQYPLNATTPPEQLLRAILATDPLRKPERFEELLQSYALLLSVKGVSAEQIEAELGQWRRLLAAVQAVDAGAIAKACAAQGRPIKEAIYSARLRALEQVRCA